MSDKQVDPSLIAALDQAGAGMKGRAQLLGEFFNELLIQDFERAEAMELVRDYLDQLQEQDAEQ